MDTSSDHLIIFFGWKLYLLLTLLWLFVCICLSVSNATIWTVCPHVKGQYDIANSTKKSGQLLKVLILPSFLLYSPLFPSFSLFTPLSSFFLPYFTTFFRGGGGGGGVGRRTPLPLPGRVRRQQWNPHQIRVHQDHLLRPRRRRGRRPPYSHLYRIKIVIRFISRILIFVFPLKSCSVLCMLLMLILNV